MLVHAHGRSGDVLGRCGDPALILPVPMKIVRLRKHGQATQPCTPPRADARQRLGYACTTTQQCVRDQSATRAGLRAFKEMRQRIGGGGVGRAPQLEARAPLVTAAQTAGAPRKEIEAGPCDM
jgi:hypothetical protein